MKLQKEPFAYLVHNANGNLVATLFSEKEKDSWKKNLGSDTDIITELYKKETTHFNLIGKSPDSLYKDFDSNFQNQIIQFRNRPSTPEIFARLVTNLAVEELKKVDGAIYNSDTERFFSPMFTLAVASIELSISDQLALREECNRRGINLVVW